MKNDKVLNYEIEYLESLLNSPSELSDIVYKLLTSQLTSRKKERKLRSINQKMEKYVNSKLENEK